MTRTGWKKFERLVATRFFNTHRVGPTGKFGPDVVTSFWSVECRERANITFTELEEWSAEVRREKRDGTVPVLAVRRCRGSGRSAPTLFILDAEAWRDLHGDGSDTVEDEGVQEVERKVS